MKKQIIVYISGIDGCGKTTQANHLLEKLQQNGINAEYQWLRWEPSLVNLLKVFKKLLGKNEKHSGESIKQNEKAEGNWHRLKQRLMRFSIVRYLWLKYASHDYFRAYKKASRTWNSEVIVMDRYIFDFVADQSINFNQTAEQMSHTLRQTKISHMQQPLFNIIIDISANTGFERKMDGTSLLHLEQREGIYKELTGDNVLHIDGNTTITEIQDKIYEWVCNKTRIFA